MGNSPWRLATVLKYLAARLRDLGRLRDVEVVITDWGSEVPLSNAVTLDAATAGLVSFVRVPPNLARDLQGDSPFPEVLALNTAARRARGAYIGRIDQDTLVGERFLRWFFEVHEGRRPLAVRPHLAAYFSNQRMVPYAFTSTSPSLDAVDQFIRWYGRLLVMEHRNPRADYYSAGVGIWLVPSTMWHACGGYDERMVYMNGMEVNMIRRLQHEYPLVNIGPAIGYDFYHLEHYPPEMVRKSSSHRKTNPTKPFAHPDAFRVNGEHWGLAAHALEQVSARASTDGQGERPSRQPLLVVERMAPIVLRDLLARQWKASEEWRGIWRRRISPAPPVGARR